MRPRKYVFADYVLNPDARRVNTYDQIGDSIKELPYLVITKPIKPYYISRGNKFMVESWSKTGKSIFAGLLPVPGYKDHYYSDWRKDIIVVVLYEGKCSFIWWPGVKRTTSNQDIQRVQNFLARIYKKNPK